MNNIEKYKFLEDKESSWFIATRWAKFGSLAAAQLSAKSIDRSKTEKELSTKILALAEDLVEGVKTNNQGVIETVAKEWEQPDLDKEGLVTLPHIFAQDSDLLSAFHATQTGQMQAIGYADRELKLPIEIASIYRTYMEVDVRYDAVKEVYDLDFGLAFEECFYS